LVVSAELSCPDALGTAASDPESKTASPHTATHDLNLITTPSVRG
jgi:hypothetical protein